MTAPERTFTAWEHPWDTNGRAHLRWDDSDSRQAVCGHYMHEGWKHQTDRPLCKRCRLRAKVTT